MADEAKPADRFEKVAPWLRWAALVALMIWGPKIGIDPGLIPPPPVPQAQPTVVVVGTPAAVPPAAAGK
jgi:hypothetical protein